MTPAELTLRVLTTDDLPSYASISAGAFLIELDASVTEDLELNTEPGGALGVFEGGELLGGTNSFSRRITVPGGTGCGIACVTHVVVAPGHRRRGIMRMLMRAQLHGLHERGGRPLAALWASEATIYGRFGYAPSGSKQALTVDARAAFRPDVEVSPEPVRELPREAALPRLAEIRQRAVAGRTGLLDRGPDGWQRLLHDPPEHRRGTGGFRFAVHPDGYAVFRARPGWTDRGPDGTLDVTELAADGPAAYAAIWRYLLDVDLIAQVSGGFGEDEPVRHLLADESAARGSAKLGPWLRLVEVDAALAARRYPVPVDVVLGVRDEFCPWNAGRWRLRADETGAATVTRTDDPADLTLDTTDLAAVYLGGTRLTALAAAGRVRAADPELLRRTAVAFLDATGPAKTEGF